MILISSTCTGSVLGRHFSTVQTSRGWLDANKPESVGFTSKEGCFDSKRDCLEFLSNLLAKDPSCVRGGHIRGFDNGTTASSKGNSGSLREEMNPLPGIIWLCKMPETSENSKFNDVVDAEADMIQKITGAKKFEGATADFIRTLNKNKDIKWIHFIGHGGFEDVDGMTVHDKRIWETRTPSDERCSQGIERLQIVTSCTERLRDKEAY